VPLISTSSSSIQNTTTSIPSISSNSFSEKRALLKVPLLPAEYHPILLFVDKNFQINTHFEILVRKLLNIFAKDPSTFAPVHSELAEGVCKYGPSLLGLEKERLMTPELLEAMIENPLVR